MTDQIPRSGMDAHFAANRAAKPPRSLCSLSVDILGVSATCVTLMNTRQSTPVCASDDRAIRLDDLQYTVGEGPSPEAFAERSIVSEPDLVRQIPHRWQHFTPMAIELGLAGVFAFPLQVGNRCFGVLTAYQDVAGPLSKDQESNGLLVANTIARSMLRTKPEGDFEILTGSGEGSHRAEFHQASGMIAVQLGVGIAEASLRIRAHAFGADRTVADVAGDIVAGRLRLDNDRPGKGLGV